MKNWQETKQIFERVAAATEENRKAALATIVQIEGSTYRRPGAKLLVEENGHLLGNVSGGCLEGDVRETALDVMKSGRSRLVHYDTSDDDDVIWGMGLGCNGQVDLFIQPVGAGSNRDAVLAVLDRLRAGAPFALSTSLKEEAISPEMLVVDGNGARAGAGDRHIERRTEELLEARTTALYETNGVRTFTEVLVPPPWLVVCGAGDDALALVKYAAELGLRVAVVDHRPAYLKAERFPGAARLIERRPEEGMEGIPADEETFVVIKTHAIRYDQGWLHEFLPTPVPYVGLLGPKSRREELLKDVPAGSSERIYGPVGLDLGGEGPEQVALSVVAEVMAVWSGRSGGHLRDRRKRIHQT